MKVDDLLEDYRMNPGPNFYDKLMATMYYFKPNQTISNFFDLFVI